MTEYDQKRIANAIEDLVEVHYDVSIPLTVAGGLQYCAPEPLGLLAPDE